MEKNEKFLVIAATMSGLYHPNIEKIFPKTKMIKLMFVFSFFPMIYLPSCAFFCMRYIIFEKAKLVHKLFVAAPGSYTIFSAFLGWSFYFNKNKFVKIFDLWTSFFQEDLFTEDRQALLAHKKKIAIKVIKIVISACLASSTFYSILTYFSPEKKLSHPTGFSYRYQSPDFEIAATYELFVTLFSFTTLVTYESITFYLLSLEQAQFTHLKKSLGRIFERISVTKFGELVVNGNLQSTESEKTYSINVDEIENMEKNLRIWIHQHQQLLRFHKELQEIYSFPISLKYIAFVDFIILILCLNVMEDGFGLNERVLSFFFCLNNYSLFYLNSRSGDIIRETGESIFEDAFGNSWYLYRKNIKSLIKIIIMKSHQPVNLIALKIYPLNSRTFFKIISMAYSFFTFFLHLSKNKGF